MKIKGAERKIKLTEQSLKELWSKLDVRTFKSDTLEKAYQSKLAHRSKQS